MTRFAGAAVVVFPADADGDCFFMLAHRAFCARAIFRRDAADTIRVDVVAVTVWDVATPFNDSIPEITWSNFSISNCARWRFSRSSRSAFCRFDIVTPSGIFDAA
jgi:hypothetical protein